MPKFLDAPTWYDQYGGLTYAAGFNTPTPSGGSICYTATNTTISLLRGMTNPALLMMERWAPSWLETTDKGYPEVPIFDNNSISWQPKPGMYGLKLSMGNEVPGVIMVFPYDMTSMNSGTAFVGFMTMHGCTSQSSMYPAFGRAYEPGQSPAGGEVLGVYVSNNSVYFVGFKGPLSNSPSSITLVWIGNAELLTYTAIGSVV